MVRDALWRGPKESTCKFAASVARTFGRPNVPEETFRRPKPLSFSHHADCLRRDGARLPSEATTATR